MMLPALPPSRIFAAFAFFLFFSFALSAQPDRGLKLLSKGQWDQAMAEFQKPSDDPEQQVIGLYGMASVYRDTGYSGYQLDTAYAYSERAYAAYRKLPSKNRGYLDNDLDPKVSTLKNQIATQAFKDAEKAGTFESYNHFLEFYTGAPEFRITKAREVWSGLLEQKRKELKTWQEAGQLLQKYGASIAQNGPDQFSQLHQQVFNGFFAANGLDKYPEFARQYPDNPFVKEKIKARLDSLATNGAVASYEKFIAEHPADNPFTLKAVDGLCDALIKSDDLRAQAKFISQNSKHPRVNEVWLAFYEGYKKQSNYDPAAIEQFGKRYPMFPYKDRIDADIKSGNDLTYREIMRNGNKKQSYDFIQKFPTYPKLDSMWLKYYQEYRKEDGSLKSLDQFATTYPSFPHPKVLKADQAKALDAHFAKLMTTTDVALYRQFVEKYPQYPEINKVWKKYFELYSANAEDASELEAFKSQYPKYPFPKDVDAAISAQQKKDMEKQHKSLQENGSSGQWIEFLEQYPTNPYKAEIEPVLAQKAMSGKSQADLEGFLKIYPKSKYRPEVLRKLYPIATKDGDLFSFQSFEKKYPDFPDKEKLKEDKSVASINLDKYNPNRRDEFEVFVRHNAPREVACRALYKLIETDLTIGEWDKAYKEAKMFESDFKGDCDCYNQLLTALEPPSGKYNPASISPSVNSENGSESAAVMTIDGSTLYFCGKSREGNIGGEDIFVSRRNNTGWSTPELITDLSLASGHEAPEGISADGNRMLLFSSGKLCYSDKTTNGWSKPKTLPPSINRDLWQADARITADGKAILFSSGKRNSEGVDIFVSLLGPDSIWSEAINLGPVINTKGIDRSGFLHPDMKTLYFSSDRPGGLGGLDIYVSKRLDNSWTKWSTPVNLGRSFNTPQHDYDFKVTTDGTMGYYSIYGSISGVGDIYIVPLPEAYQPLKVKTVTGKLLDIDNRPIDAVIVWQNLETGDTIQITRPDPVTGAFVATVPDDVKVGYFAYKENFVAISGYVDPGQKAQVSADKPLIMVTPEQMKEKGIALPINNLFFETAKFKIKSESFPELKRLGNFVQQYDLVIEIAGHTDNVGSDDSNQLLSENRANAVRDYLVGIGCNPDNITAKGYGETQPVADNESDAGRAQNRRVEIRVKRE